MEDNRHRSERSRIRTRKRLLNAEEKASHKSYRASLVASDMLMRSLGRPNREQVVSDRPANLTTLQALDLANSPLLAETLNRGAANVVKRFEGQDSNDDR